MTTDKELQDAQNRAYRKRMHKLDLMVEWLAENIAGWGVLSETEAVTLAHNYANGCIERENREAEGNEQKH